MEHEVAPPCVGSSTSCVFRWCFNFVAQVDIYCSYNSELLSWFVLFDVECLVLGIVELMTEKVTSALPINRLHLGRIKKKIFGTPALDGINSAHEVCTLVLGTAKNSKH